ncbi:MAG: NAD(P)H-hydrate epimerase [Candidatus Omnitrophica bacterium]|nr:NAD(P)H-hydrate epimerase [Candidatus Omnitrophota bacterium]MBU4478090.1 NAD(P)H-hydrate epimerase [Candidatus Omnitrophota bacterium]MCG2704156.1 NAD(P)H-hydrate epimerase [Candidatus Omnitrophota bacterium]
MGRFVTAKKMRDIDLRAQKEFGIPGLILMENAGLRAADAALEILKRRKNKNVTVLCGPGNNGGDGFVVARHLVNKGLPVSVFIFTDDNKIQEDALTNYIILSRMGACIYRVLNEEGMGVLKRHLTRSGMIIDAIFGIGLNRKISGFFYDIINCVNGVGGYVLSLDIPSGLCATTGKVLGTCIRARSTVTFALAKKGFFRGKAPQFIGRLIIVDISLPRILLKRLK